MCKYCQSKNEYIPGLGDVIDATICVDEDAKELTVELIDSNYNSYMKWFKINYCPVCGRKLGE